MISAESARDLVKNFDIWEKIRQAAQSGQYSVIIDGYTSYEQEQLLHNGFEITPVILPTTGGHPMHYIEKTFYKISWGENEDE